MSDPPAKKSKDSSSISMILDGNLAVGESIISPVHRIFGYDWRVNLVRLPDNRDRVMYGFSIECIPPVGCELWKCDVEIMMYSNRRCPLFPKKSKTFASWKPPGFKHVCGAGTRKTDAKSTMVVVQINTDSNGESLTRRPPLEELLLAHDVVLVVDGQRIPVNKKVLATQSNYFKNLFFGGFKESKQNEIEIKDVDPEDFKEVLNMIYGTSAEPITEEGAMKYLMMADIFDIKIVRDRVENFLLTTKLVPLSRKLLLSEQNKLETLKSEELRLHTREKNLLDLYRSAEYAELSDELKSALLGHYCEQLMLGSGRGAEGDSD